MNMFQSTDATSVDAYLQAIAEPRQSEVRQLHELIVQTIPDFKPKLWGAIIGYGSFHYRYESGREGDWFPIGLANRKQYISLYVSCTKEGQYLAELYKEKLPKTKIGKSCINIKRLSDVDLEVVRHLLQEGAAAMADHPDAAVH